MEGQLRREVLLVLLYHLMTRYEEVANLDDIERELRKEGIIRGIDYEERGFSVKSGLLIDDGTLLFDDYIVEGSWIRWRERAPGMDGVLRVYPRTTRMNNTSEVRDYILAN